MSAAGYENTNILNLRTTLNTDGNVSFQIFSNPTPTKPFTKMTLDCGQAHNLHAFIFFITTIHTLSLLTSHIHTNITTRTHDGKESCLCHSHTRSLGVQHLDQQVVAGNLSTQMHVAQVVLGLRAERAQLR